jgi:hypothetical protein
MSIGPIGTPPPGIKTGWINGVPVLADYPAADKGTVWRWDDGPDKPPRVIRWRKRKAPRD